jgi:23S rRNA (cytosine1962-C5)-methyltransferase
MRKTDDWKDYELLDCSSGERLERWGDVILIRPDPQVIWQTEKRHPLWKKANARYHRSKTGGGNWEVYSSLPPDWSIQYKDLSFRVKTMGFKHTGLFPEQAVNWDWMSGLISAHADENLRILNLFAYTGGATMACSAAGAAEVVHVDASKGMVAWAKENRDLSHLEDHTIRFIVDDCLKFVEREKRRGRTYHGILMDPPSYGRGPNGELWKFEKELPKLIQASLDIFDNNGLFFLINSYTTGFQASVLSNMLTKCVVNRYGGYVDSQELCLPVTTGGVLPCGASGRWQRA